MIIKKLHFIQLGSNNLTDPVVFNLESWKKTYPDFEICYWYNDNIKDLISDCPFIQRCVKNGYYGFASDYLRIKVTQLYGGMYMDTDVYCVNRIPDKYFDKPFIPWSNEFFTNGTCTGTAIYNNSINNPLFEEFLDCYREIPYDISEEIITDGKINNKFIDKILVKHGLDTYDQYHCSFHDQDLGDIRILNRIQFGFTDYRAELSSVKYAEDKTIYLMHNFLSSWCVKDKYEPVDIKTLIIRKDTDMVKSIRWIDDNWGRFHTPKNDILLLFIDNVDGVEDELVTRLKIIDSKDTYNLDDQYSFTWRVLYVGDGIGIENEMLYINHYLCTKFKYINSVTDLNTLIGV